MGTGQSGCLKIWPAFTASLSVYRTLVTTTLEETDRGGSSGALTPGLLGLKPPGARFLGAQDFGNLVIVLIYKKMLLAGGGAKKFRVGAPKRGGGWRAPGK